PLHVFDAKKVNGNLTVRRARDGETLLALDGRTYTLDAGVCVIADDRGVESLAGIMGGEASGCDENTSDVLIESALWNEINIAQTGRKLGINSDARYRFERGDAPRKPVLTPIQLRTRRAKRALAARGMVEAVTWSFISKQAAELFGGGQAELALANPIASDLSDMRPSLLPGLVAAAQA